MQIIWKSQQEKFILDARFEFRKEAKTYNELIGNTINYTTGEEFINLTLVKEGLDYTSYDLAWQKILDRNISENFVWIFIIGVALIY